MITGFQAGVMGTYGGAPWTPANITTALWLDAANNSTLEYDGSNLITKWTDAAIGTQYFSTSGGSRPTRTESALNGKTVVTFGGSQWLTANAINDWGLLYKNTGCTIGAVARFGSSSDPNASYALLGNNAFGGTFSGHTFGYLDRAGRGENNQFIDIVTAQGVDLVVRNTSSQGALTPNTSHVIIIRNDYSGTAANRSVVAINGGTGIANNTYTNTPATGNPQYALQIGASGNDGVPMVGHVAEIIILSSPADTAIRQKLEGYLAHKWGLTANLPSDHPYKSAAPTV